MVLGGNVNRFSWTVVVYEYTLNSASGLGTGDFYFRLKFSSYDNDLRPWNGQDYSLLKDNLTDGRYESYTINHQSENFGSSGAFCIPNASINASEYKITVYSKYGEVYYLKAEIVSVPATISNLGWSTFSSAYALDLSGVNAYYVSGTNNGKVVLAKTAGKVPAATGLLLEGNGTVNIPVVETSATTIEFGNETGQTKNWLEASVTGKALKNVSLTSDFYYFLAGTSEATLGFYYLDQDVEYTSAAGKAYLHLNAALTTETNARVAWIFQDEATSINDVFTTPNADVVYDLQGRQTKNTNAGLYIKNGKKFIVK